MSLHATFEVPIEIFFDCLLILLNSCKPFYDEVLVMFVYDCAQVCTGVGIMKNKVIQAKKILVVSNVSTSISNEFLWLPIFILEVYILILNLNLTTRCVGIVVRTLDCHQGDPSSNPSTAKPFCKKLCLENSLKIWLSQI